MTGSDESLAKGSTAPGPVPEGVFRLYSMRYCPFTQRARLILAVKGIKHQIMNINLKSRPDWYFEKSPLGQVPSSETSDGKIIYDSLIVCEYLDDICPGAKLIPSDPFAKAEQKMLLEIYSRVISIFHNIMYAENESTLTELRSKFFEKYIKLEEALTKENTPYFGGESVSFVDYMIWTWYEKFSMFGLQDLLDKTPRVKAWGDRMLQDPFVQATAMKKENFLGFIKLYAQNSPEAADYGMN